MSSFDPEAEEKLDQVDWLLLAWRVSVHGFGGVFAGRSKIYICRITASDFQGDHPAFCVARGGEMQLP